MRPTRARRRRPWLPAWGTNRRSASSRSGLGTVASVPARASECSRPRRPASRCAMTAAASTGPVERRTGASPATVNSAAGARSHWPRHGLRSHVVVGARRAGARRVPARAPGPRRRPRRPRGGRPCRRRRGPRRAASGRWTGARRRRRRRTPRRAGRSGGGRCRPSAPGLIQPTRSWAAWSAGSSRSRWRARLVAAAGDASVPLDVPFPAVPAAARGADDRVEDGVDRGALRGRGGDVDDVEIHSGASVRPRATAAARTRPKRR